MAVFRAVDGFSANHVAGPLLDEARGGSSPLSRACQAELAALAKEKDSEIFFTDLYRLGRRIESRRPDFARRLFEKVAEQKSFPLLAQKARSSFAALEGQGSFGAQAEILVSRIAKEAIDPLLIVPMIAGSAVYGIARAAAASRLLAGSGFASRGLGLSLASGAAGYLAEVPSFVLAARSLRRVAGIGPAAEPSFATELIPSALTLGTLKLVGFAGRALAPAMPTELPTFAGLLVAHRLESRLGLRPELSGANLVLDTLAATISLGAGARLGRGLLGRDFARFQAELELRSKPRPPALGSETSTWNPAFAPALASAAGEGPEPGHHWAISQFKDPAAKPRFWGKALQGATDVQGELLPLLDQAASNLAALKLAIPKMSPDQLPPLATLLRAMREQTEHSPKVEELIGLYHDRVLNFLARSKRPKQLPALLKSLAVLGDLTALYSWLPHPSSAVRELARRLLHENPELPRDEAKALSHLALAIAEEKIPVTDSNLALMRKLEDLHFGSAEFDGIFHQIAADLPPKAFEGFVKQLAPLYRHEAEAFLEAIQELGQPKKVDPQFLNYWDKESGFDAEFYHSKTAQARRLRWRRLEAEDLNVENQAFLYRSLLQTREFSPASLQQRAQELGKSYSEFIEEHLPFGFDGFGLLPADRKIELGSDLAYIPTSRIFFRPYHFAVERSRARKFQQRIERGAPMPSIDVWEQPNGNFLIEEGHHRSTAAFFAGAGFVKARLIGEGDYSRPRNIGPFQEGRPVPLRWIVVDDKLYHQHNAAYREAFMPKLILGPEK